MAIETHWNDEAEVVVVGYGGAGAVTAITANDAGAKVLILEKQPSDTPLRTKHTPNTRMAGGGMWSPIDKQKAITYIEGMIRIANESLDDTWKQTMSVFASYLMDNTAWMQKIGVEMMADVGVATGRHPELGHEAQGKDGKIFHADFPDLPGSDASAIDNVQHTGKYRNGAAFWKALADAVAVRKIPICWETAGTHLITQDGQIHGVMARRQGENIKILAKRAVVLTCGGFEFNEWMKQNYLRTYPVHYYGNPGNTGDGILMAMEVGADLWHMNSSSWRTTMKFDEHPVAFSTQHHETSSIFVDKRGNRFANERYKQHSFGYELTNYDCYAMCYPKVPCYWIFDEKRRVMCGLASMTGCTNPPGGIMGDIFYVWDNDNKKEIERGWIMKASTLEGLAKIIRAYPDNNGLLKPSALKTTVKRYNELCHKGNDLDFGKNPEWLQPIDDPPYYAVKLWPGGPNTRGGPKRNARAQILRVDGTIVPRLYAAGELGSIWSMLYQAGGDLAECIAFGRIAGTNAAAERIWK